jgi:hypothetical protein
LHGRKGNFASLLSSAEAEEAVAQTIGNLRLMEQNSKEASDAAAEWGSNARHDHRFAGGRLEVELSRSGREEGTSTASLPLLVRCVKRARSRATRSVGPPCVASTSSTGSSSSERSASRICSGGTPSGTQVTGNSRPGPRSMSVSPTTSARRLSTQSTRSFGSLPGNASIPTGSGRRQRTAAAPRSVPPPAAVRTPQRRAAPPGCGRRARAMGRSARSPSHCRPRASRSRSSRPAGRRAADGRRRRSRRRRPPGAPTRASCLPVPTPGAGASQCHRPVCNPRTSGMLNGGRATDARFNLRSGRKSCMRSSRPPKSGPTRGASRPNEPKRSRALTLPGPSGGGQVADPGCPPRRVVSPGSGCKPCRRHGRTRRSVCSRRSMPIPAVFYSCVTTRFYAASTRATGLLRCLLLGSTGS